MELLSYVAVKFFIVSTCISVSCGMVASECDFKICF